MLQRAFIESVVSRYGVKTSGLPASESDDFGPRGEDETLCDKPV